MKNFNPELFLEDLNSKLYQIEENILIDNDIENNFQKFYLFFLNTESTCTSKTTI